jgi:hypothetical protein
MIDKEGAGPALVLKLTTSDGGVVWSISYAKLSLPLLQVFV